ncbi:hypothetical protein ABHN03_16570 [Paenibacillus sp. NRS-1775]|uniref:homing endonuclease associated repeat-containing protein n=1 Tax=unclassified Paenibacillus TaxID=185978 RepID=UPI003D2C6657
MKHISGIPNRYKKFVSIYELTPSDFINRCNINLPFLRKPIKHTNNKIIKEYIALSNKLNHIPSATDINNEHKINKNIPTSTTIISRFGSLDTVYELSNIAYTKNTQGSGGKFSTEFLCSEIRRFQEEFGRIPTQKDFEMIKGQGYPSRKTFTNHFHTFDEALRIAGFDVPHKIQYTKEFLINEIRRYVNEFRKVPLLSEIDRNESYPKRSAFRSMFGSWDKAVEASGYNSAHKKSYTQKELSDAFMKFVDLHGRPPKLQEFNNSSYPSFWCYQNRFGSWNNTLIHYGFKASVGNSGSHHLFDNGELCKSHYEFDVSTWLRNNKISYFRNVPYSEWVDGYTGKKDCDYLILYNGEIIFLEIAGLYPHNEKISPMEKDYKKDLIIN